MNWQTNMWLVSRFCFITKATDFSITINKFLPFNEVFNFVFIWVVKTLTKQLHSTFSLFFIDMIIPYRNTQFI